MTKAYIILAHKNAEQIKKLIKSLDDGASQFFLHIDLQSKLKFKDINLGENDHCSQWWTIDNYALNYILKFTNDNVAYITFHKYTFAPDELFFQTILLNSDDPEITGKIFNDNKMFMNWENESVAHPQILTKNDFSLIKSSSCLYVRKFDINIDADILTQIDQLRLTDNFYS